jgi:hypothetical protein
MPMTEAEWLTSSDLEAMLVFLQGKTSNRKLRLLGVACCHRIWQLLTDVRSRNAVNLCKLYASGLTTKGALAAAQAKAAEVASRLVVSALSLEQNRVLAAAQAARCVARPTDRPSGLATEIRKVVHSTWSAESIGQAYQKLREVFAHRSRLIRCIFGNPFRASAPLPPAVLAWSDRTIPRIAEGIYEDRKMPEGTLDNGRLAILADALLDAGCEDEHLIAHCRQPGPHVRGCWAIDLILGKG